MSRLSKLIEGFAQGKVEQTAMTCLRAHSECLWDDGDPGTGVQWDDQDPGGCIAWSGKRLGAEGMTRKRIKQ